MDENNNNNQPTRDGLYSVVGGARMTVLVPLTTAGGELVRVGLSRTMVPTIAFAIGDDLYQKIIPITLSLPSMLVRGASSNIHVKQGIHGLGCK